MSHARKRSESQSSRDSRRRQDDFVWDTEQKLRELHQRTATNHQQITDDKLRIAQLERQLHEHRENNARYQEEQEQRAIHEEEQQQSNQRRLLTYLNRSWHHELQEQNQEQQHQLQSHEQRSEQEMKEMHKNLNQELQQERRNNEERSKQLEREQYEKLTAAIASSKAIKSEPSAGPAQAPSGPGGAAADPDLALQRIADLLFQRINNRLDVFEQRILDVEKRCDAQQTEQPVRSEMQESEEWDFDLFGAFPKKKSAPTARPPVDTQLQQSKASAWSSPTHQQPPSVPAWHQNQTGQPQQFEGSSWNQNSAQQDQYLGVDPKGHTGGNTKNGKGYDNYMSNEHNQYETDWYNDYNAWNTYGKSKTGKGYGDKNNEYGYGKPEGKGYPKGSKGFPDGNTGGNREWEIQQALNSLKTRPLLELVPFPSQLGQTSAERWESIQQHLLLRIGRQFSAWCPTLNIGKNFIDDLVNSVLTNHEEKCGLSVQEKSNFVFRSKIVSHASKHLNERFVPEFKEAMKSHIQKCQNLNLKESQNALNYINKLNETRDPLRGIRNEDLLRIPGGDDMSGVDYILFSLLDEVGFNGKLRQKQETEALLIYLTC